MKRCPTPSLLAVMAALCIALFAVSAFAQFQTGNIYGKVQAKDGSALPGVTVVLSGVGAPQTQISDAQGNFRFVSLSPGAYTLKADLAGYGTSTASTSRTGAPPAARRSTSTSVRSKRCRSRRAVPIRAS